MTIKTDKNIKDKVHRYNYYLKANKHSSGNKASFVNGVITYKQENLRNNKHEVKISFVSQCKLFTQKGTILQYIHLHKILNRQ